MNKIKSHIKWFFAVIPVGLLALITAPIIYPLAYLIEKALPNNNPLWWWLDDEIEHDETNEDWLIFCNGETNNFKYLYRWHIRNSMWNLKELIKPENARLNCQWNNEEIVELIQDRMTIDGKKVSVTGNCLNMAAFRWIDKDGNEGWQVNRGVKISEKYSIRGVSELWYKANGKLYYRYSRATEIKLFGRTFYFQFRMGATEKRYLLILKIS